MDVKVINPFVNSFSNIMPLLGFQNVEKKGIKIKEKKITSSGVSLIIGIVGDVKGNIIYSMNIDAARKIASTMMMGMPVSELDDMAKSAISELSNMLAANASINLSNEGTNVNISTPTLMYGVDFEIKMNTDKILSVEILVDDIPIEIDISLE